MTGAVYIAALSLCFTACSDFFETESHHTLPDSNHWETMNDARTGLIGIYGLMRAALADNNTQWACGDLRNGDFTVNDRSDLNAIVHNNLDVNIPNIADIADWRRFYAVINAASVFIDNIHKVEAYDQAYSEEAMKWDIAQARTLRAFAYFYMVRIWGDVPLITQSYDNGSFPNVARSPAKQVLDYAKEELIAAAKVLPYLYGNNSNKYYRLDESFWRGAIFNRLSAYAILAHICAWEGNYADAESYSDFVLKHYSDIGLTKQLLSVNEIVSSTGLFNGSSSSNNSARLVALNTIVNGNEYEATQTGHLEEWTLCTPYIRKSRPDLYVSRDSLLSIYTDVGDLRCGIDTTTMTYAKGYIDMAAAIPVFVKVNVVQDGAQDDGDFAVFGSSIIFSRMEDMLLLNAEALAALNRTTEAIDQVNKLRALRGLANMSYNISFGSKRAKLIDYIFKERRRELIGEGHRWYDLIRRQNILHDNPKLQKMIDGGGIYWPVAPEVIRQNPLIKQNTYWNN